MIKYEGMESERQEFQHGFFIMAVFDICIMSNDINIIL